MRYPERRFHRAGCPFCGDRGIGGRGARNLCETSQVDRQKHCRETGQVHDARETFGRTTRITPRMNNTENMDKAVQVQLMIDYLTREIIRRPGIQINADSPLISSGLVDSFALADIL